MKRSVSAALVAAVSMLFVSSSYATAELQGCTPGYWKNHTDSWVTYETHYAVMDTIAFPQELYNEFAGVTIHGALSLKGGSGIEGAARILIRHAVAALLNVRSIDVNYPLEKGQIKTLVSDALASLNRDQMLSVASYLMEQNELGCPLD